MIINHNIPALNTYNKLVLNNQGMAKSLEKLSSGLRINRAADDAAGPRHLHAAVRAGRPLLRPPADVAQDATSRVFQQHPILEGREL